MAELESEWMEEESSKKPAAEEEKAEHNHGKTESGGPAPSSLVEEEEPGDGPAFWKILVTVGGILLLVLSIVTSILFMYSPSSFFGINLSGTPEEIYTDFFNLVKEQPLTGVVWFVCLEIFVILVLVVIIRLIVNGLSLIMLLGEKKRAERISKFSLTMRMALQTAGIAMLIPVFLYMYDGPLQGHFYLGSVLLGLSFVLVYVLTHVYRWKYMEPKDGPVSRKAVVLEIVRDVGFMLLAAGVASLMLLRPVRGLMDATSRIGEGMAEGGPGVQMSDVVLLMESFRDFLLMFCAFSFVRRVMLLTSTQVLNKKGKLRDEVPKLNGRLGAMLFIAVAGTVLSRVIPALAVGSDLGAEMNSAFIGSTILYCLPFLLALACSIALGLVPATDAYKYREAEKRAPVPSEEREPDQSGNPADSPEKPGNPTDSPEEPEKPTDSPEEPEKPTDSPEEPENPTDSPEEPEKPADSPEEPENPTDIAEESGESSESEAESEEKL
ncbi:MAG: hypothetical protein IJU20_08370 [Clostridia bacterium]|nr:hypothetical protein [Clostridia bacterium]